MPGKQVKQGRVEDGMEHPRGFPTSLQPLAPKSGYHVLSLSPLSLGFATALPVPWGEAGLVLQRPREVEDRCRCVLLE